MIRTSFERRIQDMDGSLDEKEREVIRMRFASMGTSERPSRRSARRWA